MEELARSANFRKGAVRGFKMLFRPEEYEGRSLSGGKPNTGVQRLAIEDQKKWDFLEGKLMLFFIRAALLRQALAFFSASGNNVIIFDINLIYIGYYVYPKSCPQIIGKLNITFHMLKYVLTSNTKNVYDYLVLNQRLII